MTSQAVLPVFKRCVEAIREGVLIKEESIEDDLIDDESTDSGPNE